MTKWLITYDFRMHRRTGEPGKVGAIHMNVLGGTRSEIISKHPIEWLEERDAEWVALEKNQERPGAAMTDIVILFALGQ